MLLEYKQSEKEQNTVYKQLLEKNFGQDASVKLMTNEVKTEVKDRDELTSGCHYICY